MDEFILPFSFSSSSLSICSIFFLAAFRNLGSNDLSGLPPGIFDSLPSLLFLYVLSQLAKIFFPVFFYSLGGKNCQALPSPKKKRKNRKNYHSLVAPFFAALGSHLVMITPEQSKE